MVDAPSNDAALINMGVEHPDTLFIEYYGTEFSAVAVTVSDVAWSVTPSPT